MCCVVIRRRAGLCCGVSRVVFLWRLPCKPRLADQGRGCIARRSVFLARTLLDNLSSDLIKADLFDHVRPPVGMCGTPRTRGWRQAVLGFLDWSAPQNGVVEYKAENARGPGIRKPRAVFSISVTYCIVRPVRASPEHRPLASGLRLISACLSHLPGSRRSLARLRVGLGSCYQLTRRFFSLISRFPVRFAIRVAVRFGMSETCRSALAAKPFGHGSDQGRPTMKGLYFRRSPCRQTSRWKPPPDVLVLPHKNTLCKYVRAKKSTEKCGCC
jgi:hypothetical protein